MIVPESTSETAPVHPGPGFPTASLRYFAWLYSPPEQQVVVQALLGLEREIAGTLRTVNEHQVVHVRLEWWRQECERFVNGSPIHPLMRALAKALPERPRTLSGFVDIATWDLAGATFETRRELLAYCERWSAAMFETLAGASEVSRAADADADAAARDALRRAGAAAREVEFFADLARDAHAGRLRIPLEELEAAGIDPAALAKPPWPEPLAMLIRDRLAVLQSELDVVLPVRGLRVWAGLSQRLAGRIANALPMPVSGGRADTLAEGWHAWRAARSSRREA